MWLRNQPRNDEETEYFTNQKPSYWKYTNRGRKLSEKSFFPLWAYMENEKYYAAVRGGWEWKSIKMK